MVIEWFAHLEKGFWSQLISQPFLKRMGFTHAKIYESIASEEHAIKAPIQSILRFIRFKIALNVEQSLVSFPRRINLSFGKIHMYETKRARFKAPQRNMPARHPIVSNRIPSRTNPTEKPKGAENPRTANAKFLALPFGTLFDTIATEVGEHKAMPMPATALTMINWIPVWTQPQASIIIADKRQPMRLTFEWPRMSATAPANKSKDPQDR